MKFLLVLAIGLAAVAAVPKPQRIVGGEITSISEYPMAATTLISFDGVTFYQACGGSIINNRSILSAAHCYYFTRFAIWIGRVGSNYANSGGVVHRFQQFAIHAQYNKYTLDNDIAVLRIAGAFSFNDKVRPAAIAGPNYIVPDNTPVWAIGWGTIYYQGPASEELRHVQLWTVNQAICRNNYAYYPEVPRTITDSMLCAGWLNVGGRDQCQGDSGSALLHNNVIIGVCSWGEQCALPNLPGINVRVSKFTSWIQSHA